MEDNLNSELEILKRIVALLLSLARMAERAAGRSLPICAFMLWILRPAEAAVSAYADLPPGLMSAPFARSGNVHEDAMRLAQRFRMLAHELMREAEFALRFLTCQDSETRELQAPAPRLRRRTLDCARNLLRRAVPAWPDTS